MNIQQELQSLVDVAHTNTYNLKHDLCDYECKFHDFTNLLKRLAGGVEECLTHIQQVNGFMQLLKTQGVTGGKEDLEGDENAYSPQELFEQDVENCTALIESCQRELWGVKSNVSTAGKELDEAMGALKQVGQYLHSERIANEDSSCRSAEAVDQPAVPHQTDKEIAIALAEEEEKFQAQQAEVDRQRDTVVSMPPAEELTQAARNKNQYQDPPVKYTSGAQCNPWARYPTIVGGIQIDATNSPVSCTGRPSGNELAVSGNRFNNSVWSTEQTSTPDGRWSRVLPTPISSTPSSVANREVSQWQGLPAYVPKGGTPSLFTQSRTPLPSPPVFAYLWDTAPPPHVAEGSDLDAPLDKMSYADEKTVATSNHQASSSPPTIVGPIHVTYQVEGCHRVSPSPEREIKKIKLSCELTPRPRKASILLNTYTAQVDTGTNSLARVSRGRDHYVDEQDSRPVSGGAGCELLE